MNKAKGFTVVELVVVAIIGLLVAILIAATRRARQEAKRTICGANLHGIDQAAYVYSDSHNGKYPIGWPHGEDAQNLGQWTQYGSGAVTDDNLITPQDSFAKMVHEGLLPTDSLICPAVGGDPAADEWQLVDAGTNQASDRWAAAEKFIHYAYQDPGGYGGNYKASPKTEFGWPMFGDRGKRTNLDHGNYLSTGKASANHPRKPGSQMILGGGHGVKRKYTETTDDPTTSYDEQGCCMAGYSNGKLYDNIYINNDQVQVRGASDTWLLSSDGNHGHIAPPP